MLPAPLSFKLRQFAEATLNYAMSGPAVALRLSEFADEAEALEALAHARRK